jgi:hypothetical protein
MNHRVRQRLETLEKRFPREEEPVEIIISHRFVEPGPDGPVPTGDPVTVTRIVQIGGRNVSEETWTEDLS